MIPPNPLPGDGYLLRETPGGWEDEERAAYAGDSEDKPVKADPILALDLGAGASAGRLAAGAARPTMPGRGTTPTAAGQTIRENVQTAGIYSYAPAGNPPGPPGTAVGAGPAARGAATFAVGRPRRVHRTCAELADEGIAPDRNLERRAGTIDGLAGEPNGPRALLYTGGRETPGEGPESAAEADRYAQLLAGGDGLGVFRRGLGRRSEGSSASAFGTAFAAFAAPFGEGALPAGISTADIPPPAGPCAPARAPTTRSTAPARGDRARDRDRQLARLAGGERPLPEPRRTAGAVAGTDARRRAAPAGSPRSWSAAASSTRTCRRR